MPTARSPQHWARAAFLLAALFNDSAWSSNTVHLTYDISLDETFVVSDVVVTNADSAPVRLGPAIVFAVPAPAGSPLQSAILTPTVTCTPSSASHATCAVPVSSRALVMATQTMSAIAKNLPNVSGHELASVTSGRTTLLFTLTRPPRSLLRSCNSTDTALSAPERWTWDADILRDNVCNTETCLPFFKHAPFADYFDIGRLVSDTPAHEDVTGDDVCADQIHLHGDPDSALPGPFRIEVANATISKRNLRDLNAYRAQLCTPFALTVDHNTTLYAHPGWCLQAKAPTPVTFVPFLPDWSYRATFTSGTKRAFLTSGETRLVDAPKVSLERITPVQRDRMAARVRFHTLKRPGGGDLRNVVLDICPAPRHGRVLHCRLPTTCTPDAGVSFTEGAITMRCDDRSLITSCNDRWPLFAPFFSATPTGMTAELLPSHRTDKTLLIWGRYDDPRMACRPATRAEVRARVPYRWRTPKKKSVAGAACTRGAGDEEAAVPVGPYLLMRCDPPGICRAFQFATPPGEEAIVRPIEWSQLKDDRICYPGADFDMRVLKDPDARSDLLAKTAPPGHHLATSPPTIVLQDQCLTQGLRHPTCTELP